MAQCSQCGKQVGCSCNLARGTTLCTVCNQDKQNKEAAEAAKKLANPDAK